MIYNKSEQVRILQTVDYCPRCRFVAAKEFLQGRKYSDSNHAAEAVQAYKVVETPPSTDCHTFAPGKCNASVSWKY